ncbi:MAG: hypothetical protein HWD59_15235 [Coxiellaceae bacterium]|nr:MAG: hypothetical protein HWD59_15235 [Coxiellaceae bacterium]
MLANNHILQAMEQAGRVALEEQAVQLASDGGRLDLGAVFTQMVTAGMQANVSMQNLKIYQQAEFSGVSTFIGGELTQVVHGDRLNIAQVAAQSIGNSFGTYEGGKMDEASRAYQQAKMAQQGKATRRKRAKAKGNRIRNRR